MKILSAAQIREADAYTMDHEPVASIDLMERAAKACVQEILLLSRYDSQYVIMCGKGNNGGDGLAIARLLADVNKTVSVNVIEYTESSSPDFLKNLSRLRQNASVEINHIANAEELTVSFGHDVIIVDAILGTGINKPIHGLIAEVIKQINDSKQSVIAIDVPSGLPIDSFMSESWPVICASHTLTFQQPKLAFMFPESGQYVGEFIILDIGLDTTFIARLESPYYYLRDSDIAPHLLGRSRFAHKGNFGHSLIIAGSYGKMGAAVLASKACLHSGTGLLTTHLPRCGYEIMQTSLPEAMVSIDRGGEYLTALPVLDRFTSIGIGPGMGTEPDTAAMLKQLILSAQAPLVIDADALNMLSQNKEWINLLPPHTILTPHPKEFDRLTEVHTDSWSRLSSAQDMAQRHSVIIVLKGAITATVMPDRSVWFNSTGNPALAKGGSGDILTGIITALVSRGYQPAEAAYIGVYIHGLAADLAVGQIHPESLLATDVITSLSSAFTYLYEMKGDI